MQSGVRGDQIGRFNFLSTTWNEEDRSQWTVLDIPMHPAGESKADAGGGKGALGLKSLISS